MLTDKEMMRTLEKMVLEYMEHHNMTQEQFCERTGGEVNRNVLQPLLSGARRSVSARVLVGLARAMDLPTNALLGRLGLLWSFNDVPYTNQVEKLFVRLDMLYCNMPEEGRCEFLRSAIALTDEFFDRYEIDQKTT